jgi:hypothetical protein
MMALRLVSSFLFYCLTCAACSDVAVNPNDTEEAIWAFLAEVGVAKRSSSHTSPLEQTLFCLCMFQVVFSYTGHHQGTKSLSLTLPCL